MKTIEQKAKAYDELTAKLKEWHNGLQDGSPAKETLEYLLPQFRESEDERIRKALVKQFGGCIKDHEFCHTGFTYAEITAWLEKQKEQKPVEWSDKDKNIFNLVLDLVKHSDDCSGLLDKELAAKWLAELPSRFVPQPEQEWSEEDEKIRKTLLDYYEDALDNYTCVEWLNGITYGELCDWLKSLRPRWKPSEEQMDCLQLAIERAEHYREYSLQKGLTDLAENLKKL